MTPEPEFRIVENGEKDLPLIDVSLKVDEGKQYHVVVIEVHGLSQQTEYELRSKFETGHVADALSLSNFLESHVAWNRLHSANGPFQLRRNFANATLDLFVDVRPCPKT